MRIKHGGKKTLAWRAHQAAMRSVPMSGETSDPQDYRLALDYFKHGYAKGFAAAQRIAKIKNPKGVVRE